MTATKATAKEIELCLKCKLPECRDYDKDCMVRIEKSKKLKERRKGWASERV